LGIDVRDVTRTRAAVDVATTTSAGSGRGIATTGDVRDVRSEVVLAHFRDGRSAARAIDDLDGRGVAVDAVYVVAAGEAELLTRIGVDVTDAGRAAAEPARIIVAVAVGDEHTGDCLAVLAEHADAMGVSSVG
jgi:hypothetical protein